MAPFKNLFTWSASRHGTFRYCQRQYWWNYYGSWGGWGYDAPKEAREAYMLKNLANRWTWPGTVSRDPDRRGLGCGRRRDFGRLDDVEIRAHLAHRSGVCAAS